jgi:peptidoglycan/LPS O-acetylase OafA/YrhL
MDCVQVHSSAYFCGTIWDFQMAGVDVFFVLSGFLITGILYDTRDDIHRVRSFYIRRTLRIFPLYYGVFLAIFLLTPLVRWAWTWQWIAWPLYLGNFLRFLYPHLNNHFVNTFADAHLVSRAYPRLDLRLGHFWTLCVEEQFYLLWPWVVFTVRDRRKVMAICLACIVVVPIARILAVAQHAGSSCQRRSRPPLDALPLRHASGWRVDRPPPPRCPSLSQYK